MDFLTKALPGGVIIGSGFYPVKVDFKNWIKISELLEDEKDMDAEKLAQIFSLCYYVLPETVEEALGGVIEFYSCGKRHEIKEDGGGRNGARVFSLKEDGELIYAAFFSQYKIDLLNEPLHWYKFCALLSGLSHEHKLFKVIYYRSAKLADIKSKEEREHILKMKRIYKLSDNRSEEEKSADLAENMAAMF